MKKLVITADDFGFSQGINKAIEECYQKGVLKNASLLANAEEFEKAIKISKKNKMKIGVHLNIIQGKPLTSVPNLTDEKGEFISNIYVVLLKSFSKQNRKAIEKEFRTQIEKILKSGGEIVYLDSHKHLHSFPPIFNIAAKLAKEYGFKLRLPTHDLRSHPIKVLGRFLFTPLNKHILKKHELESPETFICISGLPGNTINKFIKKIKISGELSAHPGYIEEKIKNKTKLLWERERDMKILMEKKFRNFIYDNQIKIVSYEEI